MSSIQNSETADRDDSKSECVDTINCPNKYVSKIEEAILQSEEPLDLECTDEISTGDGLSFVLANKSEISSWVGPLPITEYPINEDASPIVINKYAKCIECKQDVLVKYLEPPNLPEPGRIVVNQVRNSGEILRLKKRILLKC